MAYKQFALDAQTPVKVYKRRGNRNVRLSVAPNGDIRVSIPVWAPYRTGLEFVKARRAWIETQRQVAAPLGHGQAVGKAHRLYFQADPETKQIRTRLRSNRVVVTYPAELTINDAAVQAAAQRAGIRALRQEAETLLPQRLTQLAAKHDFRYRSVTIKQLRGRWGSCDQHANIVLNLYLMQLPWECIDYVLLHELTHTQVLRHGPDFWQAMETVLPDVKRLRKIVREHQPVLHLPPAVA